MLWAFAGRLLISLIFIVSGLNKIFDWQTMEEALVGAICQWQSSADGIEMTGKLTEKLLPYVPVLLGIATFLELAGEGAACTHWSKNEAGSLVSPLISHSHNACIPSLLAHARG